MFSPMEEEGRIGCSAMHTTETNQPLVFSKAQREVLVNLMNNSPPSERLSGTFLKFFELLIVVPLIT